MNSDRPPDFERIKAYFTSLGISLSRRYLTALLAHLSTVNDASPDSSLLERECMHHFLASDITLSLSPSSNPTLPRPGPPPSSSAAASVVVAGVLVQVVACVEVGHAITSQVTHLEEYKERQKPLSRRLIRVSTAAAAAVEEEQEGQDVGTQMSESGTALVSKKICKVTLEDAAGTRVFGIDAVAVGELHVGMTLGGKLVLDGVSLVHGVLVLGPQKITWLGGRVDAFNETTVTATTAAAAAAATASTTNDVVVRQVEAELKRRLALFPIMNQRDRQRAAMQQREGHEAGNEEQEEEEDGGRQFQQEGRAVRGRGSRGRAAGRTRARARGFRGRGR